MTPTRNRLTMAGRPRRGDGPYCAAPPGRVQAKPGHSRRSFIRAGGLIPITEARAPHTRPVPLCDSLEVELEATDTAVVNVEREPASRIAWVPVLAWVVLFAVAHTQCPLYYSNQNQYFLHGLAAGGLGYLNEDWLANTQ